jgi:hypothetical protein
MGAILPRVIDLDLPRSSDPTPPRRWLRWAASSAALLLILAAAGVALAVRLGGGRVIHYEVTTTSGTVLVVNWTDDTGLAGLFPANAPSGRSTPTPWSTTVKFQTATGRLALIAGSIAPGDVVTCRITAGGRVLAESATPRNAVCQTTLEDAFPS